MLDASATVNALIPGPLREPTLLRLEDTELFAPDVIDTEVVSAVARLERSGALSTKEADRAVAGWRRLPCARVPVETVLAQVWVLRRSVRVSDACYVALALALQAPLLTADRRLARAVPPGVAVLTVA